MKNNKTNWGLRGAVILLALIIFVAAGNRNDTYAKTKEDVFEDAKITHRDGYTLFIRTLDLNTKFEDIKKRLDSFIK